MTGSIWFAVPCRGRFAMTRVTLTQLARTIDEVRASGVDAHAVVAADDDSLEIAQGLGFETIEVPNQPLGRKWNAAYWTAWQNDADHVIPLGSDDWIDPVILADLPDADEIRCSRLSAVVREDGHRLARLNIHYHGGDGVRIMPRGLLDLVHGRPAEHHRDRAIDTSIMRKLTAARAGAPPHVRYLDAHPYQIVDWKSPDGQLNTYQACLAFMDGDEEDPWAVLADRYPAVALDEMRAVYGLPVGVAA